MAKTIRNTGAAVILIHHLNKPSDDGLGREAGSTAQLTDIDTQVIVTQVKQEKKEAKRLAALWDSDVSIGGYSAWGYLQNRIDSDPMLVGHTRIREVTEVAYGKLRDRTDNHSTSYIGWCEDIATGQMKVLSTRSPKQIVREMLARGKAPTEVAQAMHIPTLVINDWFGRKS